MVTDGVFVFFSFFDSVDSRWFGLTLLLVIDRAHLGAQSRYVCDWGRVSILLFALPLPLVDFGKGHAQVAGKLRDFLLAPVLILKVLMLQEASLLVVEAHAPLRGRASQVLVGARNDPLLNVSYDSCALFWAFIHLLMVVFRINSWFLQSIIGL